MQEAVHDFVTLLVIVDPLGTAVMFLGLTPHASARHRNGMAWRGTLLATAIILAFAVAGQLLLDMMGISLAAFRISSETSRMRLLFSLCWPSADDS